MSRLIYVVRALELVCAVVCCVQLYRGERATLAGPALFAVWQTLSQGLCGAWS